MEYPIPTSSSVQLADAEGLAEIIKTGLVAKDAIEEVQTEPSKVTVLLAEHPLATSAVTGIKEATQRWMKRRDHHREFRKER